MFLIWYINTTTCYNITAAVKSTSNRELFQNRFAKKAIKSNLK